MSDSAKRIYLVAGATRGIGLALVAELAAKDLSAIIYAGGRNPSAAPPLIELATRYPGRVLPVKYIAADKEGNEALAREIGVKYGRVDTIVANAGIGSSLGLGKVHEVDVPSYEEHFLVNVVGPIILFQSFRELLKASSLPRFIPITSSVGSIELIEASPIDTSAYGMSKAALNWVTRKIHYENDWLVAYPQCPGLVNTDMAKESVAADKSSLMGEVFKQLAQRQPAEAAELLVKLFTSSVRKEDGGQFHSVEGGRHPW
ncbi:NAD(P)-binding protein [Pholiota conissans]|uniref:NAD(P)-binding protein n=1 Tax=Pholiota conissans TaxID=109636 RepID=A0A9P5YRZ1_9AGAR|nr:NAD(P)-binding protein [Pholiota conissans]